MTNVLLLMYLIYIITLCYLLRFNLCPLELAFEEAAPTRARREVQPGAHGCGHPAPGASERHLCRRTQLWPGAGTTEPHTSLGQMGARLG